MVARMTRRRTVNSSYSYVKDQGLRSRLSKVCKSLAPSINKTADDWFVKEFQLPVEFKEYTLGDLMQMYENTEALGQAAINESKVGNILLSSGMGLIAKASSIQPLYEDIHTGVISGINYSAAIVGGRHRLVAILSFMKFNLNMSEDEINKAKIRVIETTYDSYEQRNNAVAASNGSRVESTTERKLRSCVSEGTDINDLNSFRDNFPFLKVSGPAILNHLQMYAAGVRSRSYPSAKMSANELTLAISTLWSELRKDTSVSILKSKYSSELFDLIDSLIPKILNFYGDYLIMNGINSIPSQMKGAFKEALTDYLYDTIEYVEFETLTDPELAEV